MNPEAIPEEVLDTLKGLSHEELRLLSSFNATLIDAGLSVDVGKGNRIGFCL